MKKTLVGVAAVALLATGIAPAFAADVELSGEVRIRHEVTNNLTDFSDATGDHTNVTSQRTRLNAKATVDDRTTVFISLQDARNWGAENSTADTAAVPTVSCDSDGDGVPYEATDKCAAKGESVDVSEAYLQVKNLVGPVGLKAGRQALAYGDQRVLGGFEWSDNARRFDAWKFTYGSEAVDADLFFAELSETGTNADDNDLNGLYVTLKMIANNKIDLYYLQETNTSGKDMNTIGARVAGNLADLDYTAEYAKQGGDQTATQDKDADLMAVTAGYTLKDVAGGLRIGAEYVSASGQDTSTDDTDFEATYATNHFHYGINDLEGATNVEGMAVKLSAKPVDGLKVIAEYWMLEDSELVAPATVKDEWTEINLQVYYNLTEKTNLYVYAAQVDVDNATDKGEKFGVQLHAKF